MPDHDAIQVTSLSHGGCAVRCRCGKVSVDTSEEKARLRHHRHWHAETVGKPGVEAAKAALEKGNEHDG